MYTAILGDNANSVDSIVYVLQDIIRRCRWWRNGLLCSHNRRKWKL